MRNFYKSVPVFILFLSNVSFSQTVTFSDGFSGSSIDLTKWDVTYYGGGGSLAVTGGICDMKNGTTYPKGPYITSKVAVSPPAKIVFRVKTTLASPCYSYSVKAGFSGIYFLYNNYVNVGGGLTSVTTGGLTNAWTTDSIIWTSTAVKFYVGASLKATITTGIPTSCEPAYFMIYMDQTGGGPVYDLWVDTVYMEGTVSTAPTSVAANPSTIICSGGSTTLTENGGTLVTGDSWKWYTGSCGGTSAGTGTSITVAPTTTTTYYVRGEGCSTTGCASVTVTVNPNVPAGVSIGASANPICAGTSVTFTATPTNPGSTPIYQWKKNGSNVGTNSTTYTDAALVTGDIVTCVLTSSLTTCVTGNPATSNAITMTVNPNLPISVSISPDANPICAGTSVTFTAIPTNGGTPTYQWKLNGNPVGTNSATYTNASLANNDQVTCVMTSSLTTCVTGNPATSNAITMTVNPNLPASVSISTSANPICAGTCCVVFTATPTNPGSTPIYQWKKNGNNVGTNSSTYTDNALNNGDIITCVMTSSLTTCVTDNPATSNQITMTVNPSVPVSVCIGVSANPICGGTSVTFTATPTNGGTTPAYQWKVNGTPVGTNSTTYTDAALNNGDIITCVMISSLTTCVTDNPATSNQITMTVNAAPSISAQPRDTAVCSGDSATFTVIALGASGTYSWQVDRVGWATITGLETNPSYTGYNTATLTVHTVVGGHGDGYKYRCQVPAANGCSSIWSDSTATLTVNTESTAPVSVSAIPDTIYYLGDLVTLTVNGGTLGTGASWKWYAGGCGTEGGGTFVGSSKKATTRGNGGTVTPAVKATLKVDYGVGNNGISIKSGETFRISSGANDTNKIEIPKGNSIVVTPETTTTYCVRAEGICDTTPCVCVTVVVSELAGTELQEKGNILSLNISPSPFNRDISIACQIPTTDSKGTSVSLKVYNVNGRVVKTLVEKHMMPGHYTIKWDGTSDNGQNITAGIYFLHLKTSGHLIKKLIRIN